LRLKILKKLRTASLNSEFTGSYKKSIQFLIKTKLQNNKSNNRILLERANALFFILKIKTINFRLKLDDLILIFL